MQGVVRIAAALLAVPFVASGLGKAFDFAGATAEVAALGLPMPAVTAALVILVQLGGSLLLFLPARAWIGSALLGGFTLAATLLAHGFWQMEGAARVQNRIVFTEHMAIIGGFVLLAAWSWQARRA